MFLLGLSYMIFGNVVIDPAVRKTSQQASLGAKTLLGVQVCLIFDIRTMGAPPSDSMREAY